MIKRILFLLFLLTISINSTYAAAPKKEDTSSEPIIEIVDLKPFVVSFYDKGKLKYTLDYTIRLRIDSKIKDTLIYDNAKIRDSILIIIRKYLKDKPDYKMVKFNEIKDLISSYFAKNYPAGTIKKVLVSTTFIR